MGCISKHRSAVGAAGACTASVPPASLCKGGAGPSLELRAQSPTPATRCQGMSPFGALCPGVGPAAAAPPGARIPAPAALPTRQAATRASLCPSAPAPHTSPLPACARQHTQSGLLQVTSQRPPAQLPQQLNLPTLPSPGPPQMCSLMPQRRHRLWWQTPLRQLLPS